MVLGEGNTRMKDFYDLWFLSRSWPFQMIALSDAIRATFERRGTPLPEAMPFGLSAEFARDSGKRQQWNTFLNRNRLNAPALDATIEELARFLRQPLAAARGAQAGRKKA